MGFRFTSDIFDPAFGLKPIPGADETTRGYRTRQLVAEGRAIVLDPVDARDMEKYRAAKAEAEKRDVPLLIPRDEPLRSPTPQLDTESYLLARRRWDRQGGHYSGEKMPDPADFQPKPAA